MNKEQRIKQKGREMYLSDHLDGKTSERSEKFVFNALNRKETIDASAINRAMNNPAIAKLIEEHMKGGSKQWNN